MSDVLIPILIVMALVFGVCFLVDKGFQKLFRSKAEHRSGLSVRPSKRYASIGLIALALGIGALFAIPEEGWVMGAAGGLVLLLGIGLVTYYMTFGIFYDEEGFLYCSFGRKSRTYRYDQIQSQNLYAAAIELYLEDGKTVQLQMAMTGVLPFMDKAFYGWLRQTGRQKEDCTWFDPEKGKWFPQAEA